MRAFGVVTDQTRLDRCPVCGKQVRRVLVIFYSRSSLGGLVKGRSWQPLAHDCPARSAWLGTNFPGALR